MNIHEKLELLAAMLELLAEKVIRLEARIDAQPQVLDTVTEADLDEHYESWKQQQMDAANAAETKCKTCGGYGWELIWKTLTPRMRPCAECQS